MIAIVGTVRYNNNPATGAKVQFLLKDEPNDLFIESEVIDVQDDGRYQFSLWDYIELHEGISNDAQILVISWIGGETRLDSHEKMISKIFNYSGNELILADLELKDKYNDVFLVNDTVQVKTGTPFTYTPEFKHQDQFYDAFGKVIFPEQKVLEVEFYDGSKNSWSYIFGEPGTHELSMTVTLVNGESKTLPYKIVAVEDVVDDQQFLDMSISDGLAFFVSRDKGIKNNILNAFMVFSDSITPTKVEFFSDDNLLDTITDFTTTEVSIGVPMPSSGYESTIRMETEATLNESGKPIKITFEEQMIHYTEMSGEVVISQDPDTGEYTAQYNFDHQDEIVSILWQVVFKSVIVQKIIDVQDKDESAYVNILYQDYVPPSLNSISFKVLHPGSYEVHAYAINRAGVFFDAYKKLFVPGDQGSADEGIQIGDIIPIGCRSIPGFTPMLDVYRLGRENGWESVESIPMEHSHDDYYYVDYEIDTSNVFYIFIVGNKVLIKKVGKVSGIAIFYPKNLKAGLSVPYSIKDFNGEEIENGILDDSGVGIYYKIANENINGIIEANGKHKIV